MMTTTTMFARSIGEAAASAGAADGALLGHADAKRGGPRAPRHPEQACLRGGADNAGPRDCLDARAGVRV